MKVRGNNPNTGEEIDDYGCSMAWLPVLMIENSQLIARSPNSPADASNPGEPDWSKLWDGGNFSGGEITLTNSASQKPIRKPISFPL